MAAINSAGTAIKPLPLDVLAAAVTRQTSTTESTLRQRNEVGTHKFTNKHMFTKHAGANIHMSSKYKIQGKSSNCENACRARDTPVRSS